MEELVIDLKDLFYQILKKWRAVLVWMLVFGILFDGYGYYKKTKEAEAEAEAQRITELAAVDESVLDTLGEGLTDAEKVTAETAVATYYSTQKSLEYKQEYISKSVRMQINPACAPVVITQYLIDNHYEVEYPVISRENNIDNIIASYNHELTTEEVCRKLAKELEGELESKYIRELISCYMDGSGILSVRVTAKDRAECEKMTQVLRDEVKRITPKLQKTYGDFDIQETASDYYESNDTDLFSFQQSSLNELNSLKNTLASLGTDFTEPQKNYYKYLLESQKLEEETDSEEMGESANNKTENLEAEDAAGQETVPESAAQAVPAAVSLLQLKYLLIGLVAGAFVVCAVVAFSYIISSTLRVSSDLTDAFHMMLLGCVKEDGKKKKRLFGAVDQLIDRMFYGKGPQFTKEEQLKMICAGMKVAAGKDEMKHVFVTGSCNDEKTKEIIKALTDTKKTGIEILTEGTSVVYDPEALEKLAKADGVVFVEKIGQSLYKDIARELELCEKVKVPVIGGVVVK